MNNTLLHDTLVNEGIKKEIKDFLEFNENEATTYPKLSKNTRRGISFSSKVKSSKRNSQF